MDVQIFDTAEQMGASAAVSGSAELEGKDQAAIIVSTGASQFSMLDQLRQKDLNWDSITGFHLDEYIDLPIRHPASFRKYLWERFVSQLPLPMQQFHYLDGEVDALAECQRVGSIIKQHQIDVAFVGIGENGHLAFNDPPADFDTTEPYLVVDLDEDCRKQQLGEGWFPNFDAVPKQAISMSVHQIMQSKTIICTVPDERKAKAVQGTLEGPVTNEVPASILQQHPDCRMFLDKSAASLLSS